MSRLLSKLFFTGLTVVVFMIPAIGGIFAQGNNNGGIGGRPAYPREDNTRSESIFVHTLDPGQTASDGISVVNNSDFEKDILVYATDSVQSSGGAFACAQKVDEKLGVGNWIELETENVTLESTSSQIVPFSISVPEETEVGEYNGCIVVQENIPPSESDNGIGLSFRTAIRVAILVPGEIIKDIKIIDFNHHVYADSVMLMPKLENFGNVSVDVDIKTELKYLNGASYSIVGGQYPVLRGEVGEWNFEHRRPFWGGIFKASLLAEYDDDRANFLGEGESTVKSLTYPDEWVIVLPAPLAIVIYVLGLVTLVWLIRTWRKKRYEKKVIRYSWKNYTAKATDDIKSIAKDHDISWTKLAKANKLKAPYSIEKGQLIKVPKDKTKSS